MRGPITPSDQRDLETLVTLIEFAAISLTTIECDTFTRDELFAEVREYAGPDLPVLDRDLALVLHGCKFIEKRAGERLALR